jgi:hypothetical protein
VVRNLVTRNNLARQAKAYQRKDYLNRPAGRMLRGNKCADCRMGYNMVPAVQLGLLASNPSKADRFGDGLETTRPLMQIQW